MAETHCRAINDIGVLIRQQSDQCLDRFIQKSAITPAQLGQNISPHSSILGIVALTILQTDLKLFLASTIVDSRETRFCIFVAISSTISLHDGATGRRITFTSWVLPRHAVSLSTNLL